MEEQIRKSGLKKGSIAEQLGVHKDTFSLWCVGKVPIPDDKLEQLVAILRGRGVDTSPEEIRAVNGHPRRRGRPRAPIPAAGEPPPPPRPPPRIPGRSLLDGATLARGEPAPARARKKRKRPKRS